MKKSLIALAVAGAMTAPMIAQADATLYGKFEVRLVDADKHDLAVESDDFRVGIKGDADLGMDGVKGIYGYEFEVNPDNGPATEQADNAIQTRKAFVGATGDFGTVMAGQFGNPNEAIVGMVGNQSEFLKEDMTPDFLGNAIAYVSPTMNGFSAYAALAMNDQTTNGADEADGDLWSVGGSYSANGLTLRAGYWTLDKKVTNTTEDTDWFGIGGEYAFGATKVALAYMDRETGSAIGSDVTSIKVTHKMDALTLWADYDDIDNEAAAWDSGTKIDSEWGIGAVYALGSQGALDIEYVDREGEVAADDDDILSIGYTIKF